MKNILDVNASNKWNAGYILGTMRSLLMGKPDTIEPDAPQVQLALHQARPNHRTIAASGA